jgi:hypothetical protein
VEDAIAILVSVSSTTPRTGRASETPGRLAVPWLTIGSKGNRDHHRDWLAEAKPN